jgi:hypothetical protein
MFHQTQAQSMPVLAVARSGVNLEISLRAQRVTELDLEPIKFKLMDSEDGLGWSLAQCDTVENDYKKFLILCLKYPRETVVPTGLVDKFWHYHILDTRKYAQDCERALGYFLHHFPYLGVRGTEDKLKLDRVSVIQNPSMSRSSALK